MLKSKEESLASQGNCCARGLECIQIAVKFQSAQKVISPHTCKRLHSITDMMEVLEIKMENYYNKDSTRRKKGN